MPTQRAIVKYSGNSVNIIYVEQSSAVAVGLLAIAAALNGGLGSDGPVNAELMESLQRVMNEALEADKQNRNQLIESLQAMNINVSK